MNTGKSEEVAELSAAELYAQGTEALEARNYPLAHRLLQSALAKERSPHQLSQYALALAHHTGNTDAAIALCREAIKKDPKHSEHFLRLGIVYLIAGRRKEAIRVLQLGQRAGVNPKIGRLLQILGQRKKPVLPFLSRGNPLNKYLGKIRTSLAKKG